jgi:hypothetical protein
MSGVLHPLEHRPARICNSHYIGCTSHGNLAFPDYEAEFLGTLLPVVAVQLRFHEGYFLDFLNSYLCTLFFNSLF